MTKRNDQKNYNFTGRRTLFAAALALITLSPSAAWSVQVYGEWPAAQMSLSDDLSSGRALASMRPGLETSNPSSSPAADACLPLLHARLHPDFAAEGNQRTAGKAAARVSALSLVLGVRFALGPPEDTAHPAGRIVLAKDSLRNSDAIIAYRECRKNLALELSDSR